MKNMIIQKICFNRVNVKTNIQGYMKWLVYGMMFLIMGKNSRIAFNSRTSVVFLL